MSRQYFQIDRAPEVQPVEDARIKRLLQVDRRDTEWEVKEVNDYGQLKRDNSRMMRWLRRGENLLGWDLWNEINAAMPDLFKTKRRVSK